MIHARLHTAGLTTTLLIAAWRQSFDPVDFEYCGIINSFSRSGTKPWNPGPCIPPEEDISLFRCAS